MAALLLIALGYAAFVAALLAALILIRLAVAFAPQIKIIRRAHHRDRERKRKR